MKKIKYIVLIALFFCMTIEVNAAECKLTEDSIVTYAAVDYDDIPYCTNVTTTCDGRNNLCTSGCFPLTIASILASYGAGDVKPQNVSSYLCNNYPDEAQSRQYGNIIQSQSFFDMFNMKVEKIEGSIAAIDTALSQNKTVLASVTSASRFSSGNSGHYVAIALKNGNQYYVINTAKVAEAYRTSGWYSKEDIEQEVIRPLNQYMGLHSIIPTNCSNTNSGGACDPNTSGRTEDCYEDWSTIFGSIEGEEIDGCGTIFIDKDGNYTELHEFIQGLFTLIKIATPIIVIALSTFDYIKAIAASNADEMKKVNSRTIKRLIIGLIIFFLPFILDILFELFGLYDLSRCDIGT